PQAVIIDANGENPTNYDDVMHLVMDDPGERFLAVIERIQLAHQHLGVIRMSALRQTRLLGTQVGSDINILAELALYGTFYAFPERLFFRRFHEGSGSWKHEKAHNARLYHASGPNRAAFLPHWRSHARFLDAVRRAPLSLNAKRRVSTRLFKRILW